MSEVKSWCLDDKNSIAWGSSLFIELYGVSSVRVGAIMQNKCVKIVICTSGGVKWQCNRLMTFYPASVSEVLCIY